MGGLRHQLTNTIGGYVDRAISDYYFVPLGKKPEKDDAHYYKLELKSYSQRFTADARIVKGLQARIFWAIWNSAARGEMALYPLDTDVNASTMSGGCAAPLKTLESLAAHLDKASCRKLKITAENIDGGFARFIADMRGDGATLYFHYMLPSKRIDGYLVPFLMAEKDKKKRDAIASAISSAIVNDVAKRPHC